MIDPTDLLRPGLLRPGPRRLVIAALLAGALPLAGQSPVDPLPALPIDTFSLDNGLRVVVSEDPSTPIVAVEMWYAVGSAHEEEGRTGFAHLFEHLLFQGTENLAPGEMDARITGMGGRYDAVTTPDRTSYSELLPSEHAEFAIWLHAERMARLVVDPLTFETQREVVAEERRQRFENQPYQEAALALDSLLFDWAPYDHPVIGEVRDLRMASTSDVRRFGERWYRPPNATLVVVGDVTVDEVRVWVERWFGPIGRGNGPAPLEAPEVAPRTDGERRLVVRDPLAQLPLVWFGWATPAGDHPDQYALSLIADLLAGGESGRLHRRLVLEDGVALSLIAQPDVRRGPSAFKIGALPNAGVELSTLQMRVEEEIARLRDGELSERELEGAKNRQRVRALQSRGTVAGRARLLQRYALFFGSPYEANRAFDRVQAVTVDEVVAAAKRWLTPENRTVVVAVPGSGGDR